MEQEILIWDEPSSLSFRMEKTDIYFREFVQAIVETFDLARGVPEKTKVTRTTNVTLRGRFPWIKQAMLFIGLKKVHRFVFRNWQRTCAQQATS